MRVILKTLFIVCLLAIAATASAQPLSHQVAATVRKTWPDSFSLDGKPPKWSYDLGVILKGFEGIWLNSGDVSYFQYIQKQIDHYVQADGSIKAYRADEYNIDHINNGKLILLLYRVTGKEKYLKAAKQLREQLRSHPRTKEGGFWHKKIYPYQMWLDGLYMGAPFYAEYAAISGEDSAFNDVANQFVWMEKHARDQGTGLLYHAWDESRQQQWADPQTGRSPLVWARAMGWYASALVDALDHFPSTHPRRAELIAILNRLVTAIEKQQDKATGLWKDILNYSGPGAEKNYFEASASSQFVYAVAKGVRKGYLPKEKISIARKGYDGIVKRFIKEENGQTNLHGTVKVSGLGGNPYRDGSFSYYMSEPVIVNDPKGLGAFILASNEMEMLPTLSFARGRKVVMDNYFNRETKKNAFGNEVVWHYKWWEKDNPGFSFFGHLFEKYGAVTTSLDKGPSASDLKDAAVYIIVDPDFEKENKNSNYITPEHAEHIYRFVQNGGVLLLMANDSNNVEFRNFNVLAGKFGIRFEENLRHAVKNDVFEQGASKIEAGNPVFPSGPLVYIKEYCTLQLQKPALPVYTENGEVVMAAFPSGKGAVFAVGDPWFYNEYVDGRKLPAKYGNYKAADELAKWLLDPKRKYKQ